MGRKQILQCNFIFPSIYLGINMNTRGSDFLSWSPESSDVKGCSIIVHVRDFIKPRQILISLLYSIIVLLQVLHFYMQAHNKR